MGRSTGWPWERVEPCCRLDALDHYAELLDEFVSSVLVIDAGGGDPVVEACVHAVLAGQVGLGLLLIEGYDLAPAPGLERRVQHPAGCFGVPGFGVPWPVSCGDRGCL